MRYEWRGIKLQCFFLQNNTIGAHKNCVTMHCKINSCYRMTTLTFLRRNLLACRQEVINSFRLFRVPKSGLQIIKYFSQRHKLKRLEAVLYGVSCFKIFHNILKSVLVSFNCQTCLLSSVLCFLLGLVKEGLWFANLVLKEFSVKPM